ncbi:Nuclear hormone receptor family member nhr-28 [Aphelenchoides besseyi]|nr:Nuclear hormone receptor family member nhr-28 [Aphelenchoides besseyi]
MWFQKDDDLFTSLELDVMATRAVLDSISSPDDLMDTNDTTPGGESNSSPTRTLHTCVVCGDESDGLHFGQYTCRACAAFFRRTVSLKLEYTCKHNSSCQIERNARNMCRACRYAKCLESGMLTTAVQHARDGLGKRKDKKMSSSTAHPAPMFADAGELKKYDNLAHISTNGSQLNGMPQSNASSTCSSGSGEMQNGSTSLSNGYAQPTANANSTVAGLASALYGSYSANNSLPYRTISSPPEQTTILQLGQTLAGVPQETVPYVMNNFANMNLQQLTQQARSAFTPVASNEMKLLGRMLEGYHHFKSLRKASYTLIEDGPRFNNKNDIPQSNYGTSKKICKIEASLLMDTVEKFFIPFNSLPQQEKNHIFDNFYCLFSNTERAFRTYKMFPANDDRLLMPDGGYIRLSELSKFYENSTFIRGDPLQVARIFENAMHYIVNVVVHHMRQIEVSEMEIIALSGMFLWREGNPELSPETVHIVQQSRQQVILDLHAYYRSCGLFDADITLKVANLFLLMPKVEAVVRGFRESYSTAEIFNIMDNPCVSKREE